MKRRFLKPLRLKQLVISLIDFLLAAVAVNLALVISQKTGYLDNAITYVSAFLIYPFLTVLVSYFFLIYSILWQYAELTTFCRLFLADLISCGGFYVIYSAIAYDKEPFGVDVCFLVLFLTFLLVFLVRLFFLITAKSAGVSDNSMRGNVMIIGGGTAGQIIVNDIKKNFSKNSCKVRCIIDDDESKKGQIIHGVTIVGGTSEILTYAEQYRIDVIVFAIPSCSSSQKSAILNLCQKTGCKIRVMPSYYKTVNEEDSESPINAAGLHEIQIEDLLGREPIVIDDDSVFDYVSGKTVIVTGGGGSIGSELCRQVANHKPKRLIIFDIYENNAYDIQNELLRSKPELELTVLIGSVRDKKRLDAIFSKYRPDVVFHAAAHKHVPLMEDSPNESIKNNVFGTYNTAEIADKYNVKRFILISTDKAVNPTNIMGASKRICEMVVQSFNSRSKTEFVAVRFGNVLGSNGSVIPLFKRQIAEGGPVTVTDPNIIRYFMTIPEAVSLVLEAGANANGGEIFVLDMGEPVKIIDLAENLIRLSGYKPYTDIPIKFTGLRPGEKMYEEKLLSEEGLKRTDNRLIHIGSPIKFDEKEFASVLEELRVKMTDDNSDVRSLVQKIVPTFSYSIREQ